MFKKKKKKTQKSVAEKKSKSCRSWGLIFTKFTIVHTVSTFTMSFGEGVEEKVCLNIFSFNILSFYFILIRVVELISITT